MASKKDIKRITLESLVTKKMEREKNEIKHKEILVPSYGEAFLFEKPTEEDIFDALDELGDSKDMRTIDKVYTDLIYTCCPMLKQKETHEALGKVVPAEIVKEVFNMDERMDLGNQLIEFSGMTGFGAKVKK